MIISIAENICSGFFNILAWSCSGCGDVGIEPANSWSQASLSLDHRSIFKRLFSAASSIAAVWTNIKNAAKALRFYLQTSCKQGLRLSLLLKSIQYYCNVGNRFGMSIKSDKAQCVCVGQILWGSGCLLVCDVIKMTQSHFSYYGYQYVVPKFTLTFQVDEIFFFFLTYYELWLTETTPTQDGKYFSIQTRYSLNRKKDLWSKTWCDASLTHKSF